MQFKRLIFIAIFVFISIVNHAQVIFERTNTEVNEFLFRMANKGLINIDLEQTNLPFSSVTIINCLDTLQQKSSLLTLKEKSELNFYIKVFSKSKYISDSLHPFKLSIFPIVKAEYFYNSKTSFNQRSAGINIFGSFSKHWSYQLSFHDINIHSTDLNTAANIVSNGSNTAVVAIPNPLANTLNYNELRTHIVYSFNTGYIDFGRDYQVWGEGQDGNLVLSTKSPTYPYIKLELKPVHWFKFRYMLAWLESEQLDTLYALPNTIFGGYRETFIKKWMSIHSLDFRIIKGLSVSIGESVIFSDQLNIGYLLPFNFFLANDLNSNQGNIATGSNGQFFGQICSRNNIKNTEIYANIFIDEIRIATLTDPKKNRNQLAYSIGINNTDLIAKYLTLGLEYTKIRPFVYSNFMPVQTYTNYNTSLGYWLPNNSDRILLYAKYTPLPKLKLLLQYSNYRYGEQFDLVQQYNVIEGPQFLQGGYKTKSDWYFKASYQWVKRSNFYIDYSTINSYTLSFGVNYGL